MTNQSENEAIANGSWTVGAIAGCGVGLIIANYFGWPVGAGTALLVMICVAYFLGWMCSRESERNETAPETLKALRGLMHLTDQAREGRLILSRADGKPLTNGDQDVIDRAYIAAEKAISKAEDGAQ